ncbi:MAG: TonB-dependent receptor, partial [Xanthomonadales bacterium]|nr:TonB-dependent receptor [Xanthomonadales bacterium]
AYAQDNTDPAQQTQDQTTNTSDTASSTTADSDKKVTQLKAVTVTGSLLARPEYQTIVPIQTINIQKSLNNGSFSTADILQSTAVAGGTTQINNQLSGYLVNGGTGVQSVDLRGLGANRTLVLLDGQRPGPAGSQGAVGSFDLNVVPAVALQRIEIVKDGSSSIYGSDAISGVVNLITRKRMDGPEATVAVSLPQHGGGQQTTVSIGDGWNFNTGHILVAAQYQKQSPLKMKDRDFLNCSRDIYWGDDGKRIDSEDRSILQGTDLAGCDNLYANTIISYADPHVRYIPSPDGSTIGPFPGYQPRPYNPDPDRYSGSPNYADDGESYFKDVSNFPFYGDSWAINKNENASVFASSSFSFGTVNWDTTFLYDKRTTETFGYRQFFPYVSIGPLEAGYSNLYQPIVPFPDKKKVDVDYYYVATKLSGLFQSTDSWSWELNASHSHSSGDYSHDGIDARIVGPSGSVILDGSLPVSLFDPGILDGSRMGDLVNAIGIHDKGNTVYKQSDINGLLTGDLFSLPAGDVSAAFGLEYRKYSINDQPSAASINGWEWGYSSAQVTKGKDAVKEAFGEIGIPILKGLPGVESLAVDVSARSFKYDSVGSSDHVWKTGINWQITPTFRIRGTVGTSYRAPGLYELYLGNQSGFVSQRAIDPCVDWGEPGVSEFIKANCAAAGIPDDYAGGGSSAKVVQGGGAGFLTPETSKAKTLGIVWTPTFANINLALDYFDYKISGQVATLGAGDILGGCYGSPVYPNHYCDLFDRNSPTDPGNPNMITNVYATFINVNSQRDRGYDIQLNYSDDYSFGTLSADAQVTYTISNAQKTFSSAAASGTTTTEFVGYIGSPRTYGLAHVSLKRGNWTYNWQGTYVSSTKNRDIENRTTYSGYENARRDIKASWQLRHNLSVGYDGGDWSAVVGLRNVFDKEPDRVSAGVATRLGNVPLFASQYDWFGRTLFARFNYKF